MGSPRAFDRSIVPPPTTSALIADETTTSIGPRATEIWIFLDSAPLGATLRAETVAPRSNTRPSRRHIDGDLLSGRPTRRIPAEEFRRARFFF
eukprot:scaffold12479_cov126-Isochrysis_galbana.AAC.2